MLDMKLWSQVNLSVLFLQTTPWATQGRTPSPSMAAAVPLHAIFLTYAFSWKKTPASFQEKRGIRKADQVSAMLLEAQQHCLRGSGAH